MSAVFNCMCIALTYLVAGCFAVEDAYYELKWRLR